MFIGWEGRNRTDTEVALARLTAGCLTVRRTSHGAEKFPTARVKPGVIPNALWDLVVAE